MNVNEVMQEITFGKAKTDSWIQVSFHESTLIRKYPKEELLAWRIDAGRAVIILKTQRAMHAYVLTAIIGERFARTRRDYPFDVRVENKDGWVKL